MSKICPICNKKFFPNHNNRILCSDKCIKLIKKIRQRNWYKKNRNKHLKKLEVYRNKPENKEKARIYCKNNQEKLKEQRKIRRDKRYKIDINFKIECNLRSRIWAAIKENVKSESTMKLIGCTVDFLKQHLEKQFKLGMNWQNYGRWHIDHIRPCDSFDLSKPSEQLKCFNWQNLQPLWAVENIKKSNKIEVNQ